MNILCVGLMVFDITVAPIGHELHISDSYRIDTLNTGSGGDALNVASNLGKLGHPVKVAGVVGQDVFGDELLKRAAGFNVCTEAVNRIRQCGTATSIVLVDGAGERGFLYYGGGNDWLRASDVKDDLLAWADCLFIGSAFSLPSMDGEGMISLLSRARELNVKNVMDVTGNPNHSQFAQLKNMLPLVDYFLPSEAEAADMTGLADPVKMAEAFMSAGCNNIVIKCGGRGAYWNDGLASAMEPAHTVEQIDATGAGDAFVAGFISGLSQNMTIKNCVRCGCLMGAACVSAFGATAGTPGRSEMETLLRQHEII